MFEWLTEMGVIIRIYLLACYKGYFRELDEKSDDVEQRQGLRWSQEQRCLPYGVKEHHPPVHRGSYTLFGKPTPCGVCRVQSLSYFHYLSSAPTYACTHTRERDRQRRMREREEQRNRERSMDDIELTKTPT